MKNLIGKSENDIFDKYLKYLKTKGLDPEEVKAIKEFLNKAYQKTKNIWRPGCCRCIPDAYEVVEKIFQNSIVSKYFEEIIVKNFREGHFFFVMLSHDGKEFVIDPTGVPIEGGTWIFPNTIKPYFGLVEYATDYHEIIYKNSS